MLIEFPLGVFEYRGGESVEESRARLERAEIERANIQRAKQGKEPMPMPEEIAAMTAKIRGEWVDENGVLVIDPCVDHSVYGRESTSGIRVVKRPRFRS